jgi:hypothetical protein
VYFKTGLTLRDGFEVHMSLFLLDETDEEANGGAIIFTRKFL